MKRFQPCAIVPSYNHHRAIDDVVARLHAEGVPVFIVDDGSEAETQRHLAGLHDPDANIIVIRQEDNAGKGRAVATGMAAAQEKGFTHALQVDADGQHCLDDIPKLLKAAERDPDHLITGKPVYDDSIPTGRKIGRWITHVWVWIETLSFEISDSMCGFRVFPISESLEVMEHEPVGQRMDFDTEIMVRLFWRGVHIREIPTPVIYPEGNTSNFRVFRDNVLISMMHTRLVVTMLCRLPGRFLRKVLGTGGKSDHWADLE